MRRRSNSSRGTAQTERHSYRGAELLKGQEMAKPGPRLGHFIGSSADATRSPRKSSEVDIPGFRDHLEGCGW